MICLICEREVGIGSKEHLLPPVEDYEIAAQRLRKEFKRLTVDRSAETAAKIHRGKQGMARRDGPTLF